ncbi:unnamed protein product [Acanthoscelides obtectus]|nr:unnamed protein product [Acanthoscelides obtectus]CAK1631851.1 Odorant receptor 85b [Acanthoscelides obtectus]
MFTFTTLLAMLTGTIAIASNLFIVSKMSVADPEFLSLAEYIIALLIQFSMMCYYGSRVTEACFSFRGSLYECEWYKCSKRFKTCILIMMMRMDKPIYLTAAKFFPLKLSTIISVLKGSYSYAAMYRTVG